MDASLRRLSVLVVMVAALAVAVPAVAQTTIDATEQRDIATDILSERTYDPLRDAASDGESFFERIGNTLTRWFASLPEGSGRIVIFLVAAVVVTLAGVAAARIIRGRVDGAERVAARGAAGTTDRPDPGKLDFAAERAAEQGDYAAALRLRFEAGLTRLDMAGATPSHEVLTSGEVADLLELPEFDTLAGTFDAVAYGSRPAGREDDEQARQRWPVVVDKATKR